MTRFVALVPAAGLGSRFGAEQPKQYLQLAGRTVLEHTLQRLLTATAIDGVAVVVAPNDHHIDRLYPPGRLPEKLHILRCGGDSRRQSVAQGLNTLLQEGWAQPQDKILVHDAARCCLPAEALQRLIEQAGNHAVGGILALPLADTLKRGCNGHIDATVPRTGLWQAQTPQLFAANLLQRALAAATDADADITDEASAVERLGLQPLLVPGDSRNIKMTLPSDAELVRLLLTAEAAA